MQVFQARPELLANITAATMHPYFGITWNSPTTAPSTTAPSTTVSSAPHSRISRNVDSSYASSYTSNDTSSDTSSDTSNDTSSDTSNYTHSVAAAIAAVLVRPFEAVEGNRAMITSTVPANLDLWVTEVAAYGAEAINFTWLEALVNVLFETLLLLKIPRITAMTPYCVVCGDPTAPNLMSPAAQDTPNTHSVVPPSAAGTVPWNQTLRSTAHGAYFHLVREAAAARAEAMEVQGKAQGGASSSSPSPSLPPSLRELNFSPNPAMGGGGHGASVLVGWRIVDNIVGGVRGGGSGSREEGEKEGEGENYGTTECTRSLFVLNLGAANATLDLSSDVAGSTPGCGTQHYIATVLFPKNPTLDTVQPLLPLSELGRTELSGALGGDVQGGVSIMMPPYSMVSYRVQGK